MSVAWRSVSISVVVLVLLLVSGAAIAVPKGKTGGGTAYYMNGEVWGLEQGTDNCWPLVGATVTATYWWVNGILWNQQTDKTTTDSTGAFKLYLSRYEQGYEIDFEAGVTLKAYVHNGGDPANSYWTVRTVKHYWAYHEFILPRDELAYVYDMLQFTNTNYANILLPDGYQTKVYVSAYKALDYRGVPYAFDLPWITDLSFKAVEHGPITTQLGESYEGRVYCYATGELCGDGGTLVIDSATLYGSPVRYDEVSRGQSEYLPYDITKLTTWTCLPNTPQPPNTPPDSWAASPPYLSGSVTLPLGAGGIVSVNTYYYHLYRWHSGTASQPVQTKIEMASDSKYHINCIGVVPSGDDTKLLGYRFESGNGGKTVLHVWCTNGEEKMMGDYTEYYGASKDDKHITSVVADGVTWADWDPYPDSQLDTGKVMMGGCFGVNVDLTHVGSELCVEAWAGFSLPFTARYSQAEITADWLVSWVFGAVTCRVVDPYTGLIIYWSTCLAGMDAYLELYEVTSDGDVLVGTYGVGIWHFLLGSGTSADESGTDEDCAISTGLISLSPGHHYRIVTSIYMLIDMSCFGTLGEVLYSDLVGPTYADLLSVTIRY